MKPPHLYGFGFFLQLALLDLALLFFLRQVFVEGFHVFVNCNQVVLSRDRIDLTYIRIYSND